MADATRSIKLVVEEEKKGDGFNQVAKDLDGVTRATAESDAKTKQWEKDSALLRSEIEKSTQRIRELRTEISKTGDTSLFGDVRKEEARLRNFEQTLKALAPEVEKAGAVVGTVFSSGIGAGLKDAPVGPILIAALVGAAILAAPTIGALVAGAVTGLVGLGGIAAGVFAASHDPKVKAAAQDLGQTLMDEIFGSGSATFAQPLVSAIASLKRDLPDLGLGALFGAAAPLVGDFAKALGSAAKEFLPGFTKAIQDAGPAFRTFDAYLPTLAKDAGDFFDKLASNKGTVEGAAATMNLLDFTVRNLGSGIAFLSNAFDVTNRATAQFAGAEASLFDALGMHTTAGFFKFWETGSNNLVTHDLPHAVGAFHELDDALTRTANAGDKYTQAINAANEATHSFISAAISADQANIAVQQGFLDLEKTLRENGNAWDGNTAAALSNRAAIFTELSAIEAARQATIASGGSTKDATVSYMNSAAALLDLARKAGATKDELDALAKKYVVSVAVNYEIGQISSTITKALSAVGFHVGTRAAGGPAEKGEPLIVGDGGRPELFVPKQDGYILPSVPSATGGTPMGGGGTTQTITVSFAKSGDSLSDAILEMLRMKVSAGYSLG